MVKMNKKIQDYAVFIEFLVGSGLAIFFHMVLHYQEAAYVIFAIGILLSLVTYLVREDIEKTKARLLEQYQQVHELPFALAQIPDPECRTRAHELIASTLKTVIMLQQGYIPLEEVEFYLEGARLSDQSTHRIKAVDPLSTAWLTRGALINFYQSNLRAQDRAVCISRIFVTSRDLLADPENQKVLIAQYRDNIDVRVAFREELPGTIDISGRDTNSSFDFTIYDDRAVTDVFAQAGKYYGRKTGHPSDVAKYLHLFDLIEHSAHAVTVENEKIILATEVLAQAV
ncbi:MAG TPA: hypothetical protein VHN12_04050 [Geobacteraceae bacterium]|nr:hypothetical protein [Geobacteraceae bacterium]